MRAEQTVSEMVVEVLARQAEELANRSGQPFDDAFADALSTPAGRRLGELADGPHRHEKAAQWQAGLLGERVVKSGQRARGRPRSTARSWRRRSSVGEFLDPRPQKVKNPFLLPSANGALRKGVHRAWPRPSVPKRGEHRNRTIR